jgi:hypothetical protein
MSYLIPMLSQFENHNKIVLTLTFPMYMAALCKRI